MLLSNTIHGSPNEQNSFSKQSKELSKQEINNLISFAQLYGYIRYFYPSKQGEEIDWEKFAIFGVRKTEVSVNNTELLVTLKEIFEPIAPNLKLSLSPLNNYDTIKSRGRIVYTEYYGNGISAVPFPLNLIYKPYKTKSVKYNKNSTQNSNTPNPNKLLSYELKSGIYCYFSNAAYLKEKKPKSFNNLKLELNNIIIDKWQLANAKERSNRIASIIIGWNILQHFYPYFPLNDDEWEGKLPIYLNKSSIDKNEIDFYNTLSCMLAEIDDGHVMINPSAYKKKLFGLIAYQYRLKIYYPKIQFDIIDDTVIILNAADQYYNKIKPGDVVISFNKIPSADMIKQKSKYISASTPLFKNKKTSHILACSFKKDSLINLKVQNGKTTNIENVIISTNTEFGYYKQDTTQYITEVDSGIYYINQTSRKASFKDFKKKINSIKKANGIIIDIRGYPKYFTDKVIGYFIQETIYSANFITPITTYPNRENINYKVDSSKIKARKPYINTDIVFLTNEMAISYAETILGIIKNYKIGKIIGTPTAGTNGDITKFTLPIYSFYYTGLKVLKHDGTQLYGVGIEPDIIVAPTVKGIMKDKDELLERAIEYLKTGY